MFNWLRDLFVPTPLPGESMLWSYREDITVKAAPKKKKPTPKKERRTKPSKEKKKPKKKERKITIPNVKTTVSKNSIRDAVKSVTKKGK